MTRSQLTLAGPGFEKYTKVTRRAQFLAEMDRVVPWRWTVTEMTFDLRTSAFERKSLTGADLFGPPPKGIVYAAQLK